jgi:hypothetical protein
MGAFRINWWGHGQQSPPELPNDRRKVAVEREQILLDVTPRGIRMVCGKPYSKSD